MNKSLVFFMDVLERLSIVFIIISSVCIIELGFTYIFNYEKFNAFNLLFHLYGFIVGNLVCLFSPQVKKYLMESEENAKD
jgi:hypothetical protein